MVAKLGIEVEGRLKGIKTAFCSAEEFLSGEYHSRGYGWVQLYISDHKNIIPLEPLHKTISYWSNLGFIVTIERTKVPSITNPSINIILYVKNDSFWNLKPSDQVKFERDLTVRMIPIENMTLTEPWEFEGDQLL